MVEYPLALNKVRDYIGLAEIIWPLSQHIGAVVLTTTIAMASQLAYSNPQYIANLLC